MTPKSGVTMIEAEAEARAALFPVVFFDGEQETSLGDIVVFPSLNFKGFQSILAEKIGLSPHQFSIYLADRRRRGGGRIPVTGKTDFSAISRGRDCFFLVVLKRSRRERRRRSHDATAARGARFDPPANVMLLRRDGNNIAIDNSGSGFPGLGFGRAGYDSRVRELQVVKARYLMDMGLGSGLVDFDTGPAPQRPPGGAAVCEECSRARELERDAGFHWCVHDTVTFGFRSPAGPIARPVKGPD